MLEKKELLLTALVIFDSKYFERCLCFSYLIICKYFELYVLVFLSWAKRGQTVMDATFLNFFLYIKNI